MRFMSKAVKILNKYIALVVLGLVLGAAGIANAASTPSLTVTPNTNLKNGDTVSVSGSGFPTDTSGGYTGALLECNSDPNQPNGTFAGNAVPISCSSPGANGGVYIINTTDSGDVPTTNFVVHTGTIGPPDSSPTAAEKAEAAQYPCPPTAAEIAKGDKCWITFGTSVGGKDYSASDTISFYSSTGESHTATTSHTNTTPGGGGTTTPPPASQTSQTESVTSTTSNLPNTGPGNVIEVAAILAAVSSAGYLVFRKFKKSASK